MSTLPVPRATYSLHDSKRDILRWRIGLRYNRFKLNIRLKQFWQKLRWSPLPKRVIGAARRRVLDSGGRAQ